MPVQTSEITIAHSPDSDDAFMFYPLAHQKVDTQGLKINQALNDIQSLNQEALNGRYEVTAVSFAAYPHINKRYKLMTCGASMGDNYGPVIVARPGFQLADLEKVTVAIPGTMTSAYLAFQLWAPYKPQVKVVPFEQILELVASGEFEAGLVIHEGQLSFAEKGLVKLLDLGQWFQEISSGLPLPLGACVVRKDLGEEMMQKAVAVFKAAVVYALANRREALNYALGYAGGMEEALTDKFVGMYVNEMSVDFGERGKKAVRMFFQLAHEKGLLQEPVEPEFV